MDISRMKKHVGQLKNTGVRCVVVFRTVPGDPKNCLIIETDRLPDMYHDNVLECVNSPEAQKTNDFHDILNRRTFADGLNALQALHYKGFLRKTAVSQVTLLPFPGQELPLELLNAQLDGTVDDYNASAKIKADNELAVERKANPMSDPNDTTAQAEGLLLQAELLEAEAVSKRNEAYALAPSLLASKEADDSKSRGRPKLSAEEKAIKAEERKIKRRERDREKAAEKKAADAAAKQKAAIDEKILRDANRLDK